MSKNQKIFFKKLNSIDEFIRTYQKIHRINNGRKNQNNKLNNLLDFRSQSKKVNNAQNIGIIKEKNHKRTSLFHTTNSSHHQLIQPEISNNFTCKLNTKKRRNHIIIPK